MAEQAYINAFIALRNATLTIENAKSNLVGPLNGQEVNQGSVLFDIETAELHLQNARSALTDQHQGGGRG